MLKTRFKRLREDRRGATAVEFAIIAAPFFLLIFAIMEIALVFMLTTTLDNAMSRSARQIRTGELQSSSGATAATFRQQICDTLNWVEDSCNANLLVDVRTFEQFADTDQPDPVQNGAIDSSAMVFEPGGPEDIVLVRVFLPWDLFTPLLNPGLARLNNGQALIVAGATFRNEPWVQE